MINIHLNGDVVRCPDIAAIHIRAQEVRDKHGICKYGYLETNCNGYLCALRSHKIQGRCSLFGSVDCPGHILRTNQGNKEKIFKIDNSIQRKISSAATYLVNESEFKTLFITLTFPPFRKKHKLTKHIFENEILNKYFSRFVKNLRETYNCRGYIAVRERGKAGNRVHYHLCASIPFVSFALLNDVWCNTIKDICVYSDHAFTTKRENLFIREPTRSVRYICKYFSKAKGQESESRIYFISNNIIQKPKALPWDINFRDILTGYGFRVTHTSDYTTLFRVEDPNEYRRFFHTFIKPFFELTDKKAGELYAFPINSS